MWQTHNVSSQIIVMTRHKYISQKVKVTKAQRVSRSIALPFHEIGAYIGVGDQHHGPAASPPGKTRYALYRRLVRPQGRSGRVRKISPPQGFDHRTVQRVVSRHTDCAIPAHKYVSYTRK